MNKNSAASCGQHNAEVWDPLPQLLYCYCITLTGHNSRSHACKPHLDTPSGHKTCQHTTQGQLKALGWQPGGRAAQHMTSPPR